MSDLQDVLQLSEEFCRGRIKDSVFQKWARKDVVDALRTVYWHNNLLAKTGEKSSYALEDRFDNNSFYFNADGKICYRHKWQRYAKGKNVPSAPLIEKVEEECVGSANAINHVLWKVLRADNLVAPHADNWLRQLEPGIQTVVFQVEHDGVEVVYRRAIFGRRLLDKIANRASLDALACLTILFREAIEFGRHKQAFDVAMEIHWLLLVLGIELQRRKIAHELIQVYVDRVFPLVEWNGLRVYPESTDYPEAASVLNILPYTREENRGRCLSWAERVRFMRNYIRGNGDFVVRFGLALQYGPCARVGLVNSKDQKEFEQRQRLAAWGLEALRSGSREKFPPLNIWLDRGLADSGISK